SARSGTVAAVLGDAEGSGLVDLFLLAGFIVGIWAIPRFGRIPLQVTGFAGMALGMLLLMFAAMAGDGPQGHLGLIIAGFVLFNFAMNAGPNATTFTLPPVLFPTAIRASASGFAAACAKVGATFGTFLVPQLQAAWGLTGVLALMAFVSIGGLLATAAFAHAVDREDELEELPVAVNDAHKPAR
ncbi:MAG: MFS transporter, partial [Pseudolabrys sp.]